MAPIKVGLIGFGFSTKCFHLPFITVNKDLEVYAFFQRKEAPEDKSKSGVHCTIDYPKAKHYRTADEFFGDKEIELVSVCSGGNHTEYVEKALNAGKNVVVEKPFTDTAAEAEKLIALAKEKGKVLTVFQNRRYDSDFRTLEKLVKQNAFGKVTEFENHYDSDYPEWCMNWKSENPPPGEGMMYGLGTHSIDQTLELFGTPASVTAFQRTLRPVGKSDDSFTIILQYSGEQKDLISTIKTTIVSPLPMHKQPKYMIRGTHGAFIKGGEDPQVDHLFANMKADDKGFGIEPESYHGYLNTTKESAIGQKEEVVVSEPGSYADYYVDVVKAIRGEIGVVAKPDQSRDGIRVIELAKESCGEGCYCAVEVEGWGVRSGVG